MVTIRMDDLREKVPVKIVEGADLEKTMNELFRNFEAGEQRNAELVNRFFDQTYFKGDESLIDKFIGVEPNIKFDHIKDEGINLAVMYYNNWMWDFKDCLGKVSDIMKKSFIGEIYNKVRTKLGGVPFGASPPPPYNNFDVECPIPLDTNVLGYFQKVVDYLNGKEGTAGAQKTIEVLKEINIRNDDLNASLLPLGGMPIPPGVDLSDPSIPISTKNDFDTLLSFEIGKEADRTLNIAKDFSKSFQKLLTNSLPAINTVVGESDEYRYDEGKLGTEYQGKVQVIIDDTTLSEKEKNKKIDDLRREYYIKYLKAKNAKIGNALEQLYNNDFDYSKIERSVLKDYFDKVADIRLQMLFDKGINEYLKLNWGNVDEFKAFYKELTDVDPASSTLNISLSNVNVPGSSPRITSGINIPVQKKLVEGPNNRLKNIDQFGKDADKSFDAFPMEFTINKADIDALDINIEDRTKLLNLLSNYDQGDKYVIKGENIGTLIYLFFIINTKLPITDLTLENQKEVENLFGQAKNHKTGPEDENTGENTEENEGYSPEQFKNEIEELGPGKFENGSEIWIPASESEIPGGGYQWMKIKISNLNMSEGTFTGTVFGGELKFGNYEGKSKKFKMDKKTLEKFKETSRKASNTENNVWLQPNPNKSDFNSFRESLNGMLGTSNFTFPTEGVVWNGNKFIQKIVDDKGKEKEVEIKYFGASADDKSTYKIEYNPIRRSFTVSSTFNGDEKGKDGKSEKKRFSYKRDMDWNNFLIFFNQKGLRPQTKEESNDAIKRQDKDFKMVNGGHRKLNWFSINNIKHGFKDIFGALKKKIDDYNKKQDEEFRRSVEGPILKALGALPLLPPSLKSAIGERQQEIYNEEFNGAWIEIEKYLKALQSDGQFADTFDQVPPHVQTLYGKSYQEFIKNLYNKKSTSTEEKRKAAALLLANFEKGGSPFRGLSEYENKGLWVKVLLGEDHYQQFLRDKAACIRDRDLAENSKNTGIDKKGLNEQLATCEMDYIINNVRGAYPKLPMSYFPSHENRGIDGDKSTNYIPNPSKRLLSETFANKLEDAKKGRFTKSSVEEAYGKNKSVNRFEIMEDDFSKMGSSRYKQGAGALRRMIDLASDEPLRKRMKRHFLTFLLSGALDVNCDPGLKKQIYGWAKPMMFVPGLLVKEAGVAENIAVLLDDATNGDFSRNVTKYFHRNGQLKGGIDFKGLQEELKNWLTDKKMNELDKYFSELPTKDISDYSEPKHSIIGKFQKAMSDSTRDEGDWGILDNPNVVSNGLLSSVEVVQKRMNIKNGEFNGKDIDENNNMKDFRKKVTEDINGRSTKPREVAFVLDKFFNRFGLDNQQIYERIVTANFYDKNRGPFTLPYKGIELNMGNIGDTEINSILWYAFQGNAWKSRGLGCDRLPDELFGTLQSFQKYFRDAFFAGTLLDNYVIKNAFRPKPGKTTPLLMGSRDVYDQAFAGDGELQWMDSSTSEDDLFSGDSDKKKKAKKNKTKELLRSSDFINSDIVNIEKQLKRNLGGTSGQFPSVTSSHSRTLREEYLRSRLAA